MRVVLALPAAGLLAGVAIGMAGPSLPTIFWFICLAVSACGAACAWYASHSRWLAGLTASAFLAGGALLSIDAWDSAWNPTLHLVFDELVDMEREDAKSTGRWLPEEPSVSVVLSGVLRADAALRDTSVSLSLDAQTIDSGGRGSASALCARAVQGGVVLSVAGDFARTRVGEWRAGRTIRAPVRLQRAQRYLDEGVPDAERALARRGTRLVGSVKSGALVDVISRGSALSEAAAGVRAHARQVVQTFVAPHSARAAGIVTAIIIGDRAGLDPEVERSLQDAGTYHVIAISGGNIAILASLILVAFRAAGMLGRSAMLSAIAILAAYAYVVGGGASVDRATLMAVAYFGARALDLRGPPLNGLALVAVLLAAADPLVVADPAFLLTSGATFAILATSSIGPTTPFRHAPFPIPHLMSILVATLAAEVVLFPIGAIVFSRITVAGLALNFAAIPMMAVTQVAGMLLWPASVVSRHAAQVVGWIAAVSADSLVWSAGLVRLVPATVWRVAPPAWTAVVLYYSALVATWRLVVHPIGPRGAARAVRVLLAASACWILFEPWTIASVNGDGRLHVTFIDVGQGDAAFVRFPRGQTLLVDTGGLSAASGFDVGDRVVAPVLRLAGIRRLDAVALTHGDADHIGGAAAILDEFRPREIWEGIPVPSFEPLRALRVRARADGARWTNVQAADRMTIDDVDLVVRHPGLPDWERQDVRNDDSVVLELRWGEASIVLTGDIGRETEEVIAPIFAPARLRVVKVPHHGSQTSSSDTFVAALSPRIAVVSVGRSNSFGHPVPAVLERYRAAGAEILRTDQDGEVTVTTDGHSMEARTFTGRVVAIPPLGPN